MKRSDLLGLLRYAGYHDDARSWVRLTVENPVSISVAKQEWRKGERMKASGERCSCAKCAVTTNPEATP